MTSILRGSNLKSMDPDLVLQWFVCCIFNQKIKETTTKNCYCKHNIIYLNLTKAVKNNLERSDEQHTF